MKKYSVKTGGQILIIPTNRICVNPNRNRRYFSNADMLSLCASIMANGLITPLAVSVCENGDYMIISGERRFIASQKIGLDALPCVVYSTDTDFAILSLNDSLHTQKLNSFELADAYGDLYYNKGMSLSEISEKLSVSEADILLKLRLLNISDSIRAKAIEYSFDDRELLRLVRSLSDGSDSMVCDEIIKEHRDRENAEKNENNNKEKVIHEKEALTLFRDTKIFENTVERAIDTMQKSGFQTLYKKDENEEAVEYKIRIVKKIR